MNENPKIRAQSFKELLLSFQSGAVFKSFISYNCIVMCSASFYYRLTNVSILHSGEFEFTLFTIISSCTSVFCILTQPFKQGRPQTARPSPILFTTVLSAYIHVSLARGFSQPWNLEHTCWEHVALCVSEFLQKSLSLQRHFVDLIVCDLSRQQNSVEETINIQVNLSLQCFTTTCCWNLSPSRLFEGIRPELQKALWSTLKLAYFVKIPKASSQFLWDVCLLLWPLQ